MKVNVDQIGTPSEEELAALPRELKFCPSDPTASLSMLSPDQVETYNQEGYLLPFDGLDDREVADLRAYFDGLLDAFMELGRDSYSISTAHLRFGRIYDLMFHPHILAPIADLLGPDVVGWGAHFFCKLPGDGKRVAWHQDATYWPLSPTKTVAVWLAIDDADPENANMRYIPRTHLQGAIEYSESDREDEVLNLVVEDVAHYGESLVDVRLKAGQFSLHSDLLLHGSEANHSDRRRCGLTFRYAAAEVQAWCGWEQKGIIVSGKDRNGHWLNAPRPR